MAESGARMVEVGTTNKTHLSDYEGALSANTGLMLKVHSSNYRVVGFTDEVSLAELVQLGAMHGVPVMEDQGSGVLIDLSKYGIADEPTVGASRRRGRCRRDRARATSCSAGRRPGCCCGRADVIHRLKKHPMARALRLDKMTLAALEATLFAYLDEERALREVPTLRMLTAPQSEVRARAEALAARIRDAIGEAADVTTADDIARAGGGSLPLADIASAVVVIAPRSMAVTKLETLLRCSAEPAVVARVKDDHLLIDPRTLIGPAEEDVVVARLMAILGG